MIQQAVSVPSNSQCLLVSSIWPGISFHWVGYFYQLFTNSFPLHHCSTSAETILRLSSPRMLWVYSEEFLYQTDTSQVLKATQEWGCCKDVCTASWARQGRLVWLPKVMCVHYGWQRKLRHLRAATENDEDQVVHNAEPEWPNSLTQNWINSPLFVIEILNCIALAQASSQQCDKILRKPDCCCCLNLCWFGTENSLWKDFFLRGAASLPLCLIKTMSDWFWELTTG